jgi:hypothetical protein
MELSQLFTRGTPAAEVPADFRGMPGREWQAKQLAAQASTKRALAFRRQTLPDGEPTRRDFNTKEGFENFLAMYPGKTAPLCDRKITTPQTQGT